MTIPLWLPPLAPYVCDGDPDSFEKQLYASYLSSFVEGETRWHGRKIVIKEEPRDARGRDWSYRHLTTVGDDPRRKFDRPRAERLPWIKPVLEASAPDVVTWLQPVGGRVLVAVRDFTYLVILNPLASGDTAFLVTAYPLTREKKRQEFRAEYGRTGELIMPVPVIAAIAAK